MIYKPHKENKYHNIKSRRDGITFDSRAEGDRYRQLQLLEKSGKIRDLCRQTKYVLIPAQYRYITDKRGNKKKKLIEREAAYWADFDYYEVESGKHIVEDVKGVRTREYILKRKLMLSEHDIQITEIDA